MLTVHLPRTDRRASRRRIARSRGPQQRAVVAHLALDAGHVVSVERLIDRLWGDEPPRTPLGTLQSYVSRLRRAIEPRRATGAPPEVLVSEAPGYVLRVSPEQVDVHRFRQLLAAARRAAADADHARAVDVLDEALGLWRSGARRHRQRRPGATGGRPARGRAQRRARRAFRRALALGRHQEVIPQLQAAVEAQPLHERLWRCSRSRTTGRAVRRTRCERCHAREVLADELGLDLGPELRDLEQRILVHDPTLVLAASPSPSAAAPGNPTSWCPRRRAWWAGPTSGRRSPAPRRRRHGARSGGGGG
ncbi:MAG: BTAD domain-containing putative transcriptional regulator [Ilumatobacteraceae bacterium]